MIRAFAVAIAATGVLVAAGNDGGPGVPDRSFGHEGRAVTVVTRGVSNLIAAQFDSALWVRGKLWVSGGSTGPGPWHWSSPNLQDPSRFTRLLLRYLPDGRLDPTFGNDGVLRRGPWDWFNYDTTLLEVALPDGSVIAARRRNVTDHGRTEALVRLRPDGAPDPRFGRNGVVRLRTGRCDRIPNDLVRQPDGKLVALVVPCGHERGDGTWFALARLLPDGGLDPSFGKSGVAAARVGPQASLWFEDGASHLVRQPDGKLLVAGLVGPGDASAAVARFDADGALDHTFGSGGVVQLGPNDSLYGPELLMRANGEIVVSTCEPQPNQPPRVMLHRLDALGAPVTAWGVDGSLRVAGLYPHRLDCVSMLASPGGKILVTGRTRLARLDDAGTLDASFGRGGYVQVPAAPQDDDAVLLQPGGKILYAGKVRPTPQRRGFLLQRFLD